MNIAELAIRKKVITLTLCLLIIGIGILAYDSLGRLEDPEFTIKEAKVITYYPGASPLEVEQEVTDIIETEIQKLGQIKKIKSSTSQRGLSIITPEIKDEYDKYTLPQVWDELRHKVQAAQPKLPPGAQTSIVNDDFGDVFGIFFAVYGEGYSYRELKDIVDMLRKELLLVPGVAKIDLWGTQQEQVFVEISRLRIAQLGISLDAIYNTLESQNLVVSAGKVKVGDEYITIAPTGEFDSVAGIGDLLVSNPNSNNLVYLRDLATISRGYKTPPDTLMRYNGKPAIGLALSTVQGGNVVEMGKLVEQKLDELAPQIPLGVELGIISYQSKSVTEAINAFIANLIEALAIVILVLMVFMGLRSGLLIGAILLLTVLATFIVMSIYGITLQRISLGALVIALGMLVDNAIVVTDSILVRITKGEDRIEAAKTVVSRNMWPLLGATVIAILAFAAVGLSQDATGEFTRSLFQVMLISLMASWIIAITITPLFCVMFLKPERMAAGADPYGGRFYSAYRGVLRFCIRVRYLTLLCMVGLLALAIYGFGLLSNTFFQASTRPQFMVHYWLPEGTDIRETSADLKKIEAYAQTLKGVTNVSTFVGQGPSRFLLTFVPEDPNQSYGLLLIDVEDNREIPAIAERLQTHIDTVYPDAQPQIRKFELGPGEASKIQVRLSGTEPEMLRSLAERVKAIMREEGAEAIKTDWRERVKKIVPIFSEVQARRTGITREDLSRTLESAFSGTQVGIYREGNKLLPIISRPPGEERLDVENINDVQIWNPIAQQSIPLLQVVSGLEIQWEDPIIKRRNRKRTITVKCDAVGEPPSALLTRIMPKIEAVRLPPSYELEWGGEYENSRDAQGSVFRNLPIPALLMVLTLVFLFNAIRQPLIILLTIPLSIVGVSAGLLATNQPFGFMALLGLLSLSGLLIKNAIVLIDQIDTEIHEGRDRLDAIIDSAVSRTRPVAMAALTTMLGMTPLLTDDFYVAMAVTIAAGLGFATVLTLIVVPVLYAVFFRVPYHRPGESPPKAASKANVPHPSKAVA
jgi:multidrug efflux pump subunit AcrB